MTRAVVAASTPAGGEKSCLKLRHLRVKRPAMFTMLFTCWVFFPSKNRKSGRMSLAIPKNKTEQENLATLSVSGDNLAEGVALPSMTLQRADFQNGTLSGKAEMSEQGVG